MHAIKQTSKQILILSICTVILINSNVLASQWDITIHEAPTGQFQNSRKKTAQLIEDNNRLRVQPTDETENIGRDNQLFLSLRTVADLYHRYENGNQQNCILQFYTKKNSSGKPQTIRYFLPYSKQTNSTVTSYWQSTVESIITEEENLKDSQHQTILFSTENITIASPADIFVREYKQTQNNDKTNLNVTVFCRIDGNENAYELSEKAVEQFKNYFFQRKTKDISLAGLSIYFNLNNFAYKACVNKIMGELISKYQHSIDIVDNLPLEERLKPDFPNALLIKEYDKEIGNSEATNCTLLYEKDCWPKFMFPMALLSTVLLFSCFIFFIIHTKKSSF